MTQLLFAEGVDTTKAPALLAAAASEPNAYEYYLPLYAFDDTDFEIHTPQQWVELMEQAAAGALHFLHW